MAKTILVPMICTFLFISVIGCSPGRGSTPPSTPTQTPPQHTKTPPSSPTAEPSTKTATPTGTPIPTSTPIPPTRTHIPPTATVRVPQSGEDVLEIEKILYQQILSQGVGDRFVIPEYSPYIYSDLVEGSVTVVEREDGEVEFTSSYPGEELFFMLVMQRGGDFTAQLSVNVWIHRFSGTIQTRLPDPIDQFSVTRAICIFQTCPGHLARPGYSFIGEGEDLNLLTFARVPTVGYVYLRGEGRVISPRGLEFQFGQK